MARRFNNSPLPAVGCTSSDDDRRSRAAVLDYYHRVDRQDDVFPGSVPAELVERDPSGESVAKLSASPATARQTRAAQHRNDLGKTTGRLSVRKAIVRDENSERAH